MSAEAISTPPQTPANPAGLFVLAGAEMWERFSSTACARCWCCISSRRCNIRGPTRCRYMACIPARHFSAPSSAAGWPTASRPAPRRGNGHAADDGRPYRAGPGPAHRAGPGFAGGRYRPVQTDNDGDGRRPIYARRFPAPGWVYGVLYGHQYRCGAVGADWRVSGPAPRLGLWIHGGGGRHGDWRRRLHGRLALAATGRTAGARAGPCHLD